MAMNQIMTKTYILIVNSCASTPTGEVDNDAEITEISKGISPFLMCSTIFFALTIISRVMRYKGTEKIAAKTAPKTYFLRKKCPTPGYTSADNNAAFIGFFNLLPNLTF